MVRYLIFNLDNKQAHKLRRFSGSIVASGATRGTYNLAGHKSWLVTIYLQAMFPGLIIIFSWLLPESPRWLYVHGKQENAKKMLGRFHGEGNVDSIWVKLQLAEYEEHLEMNGSDKRWWDYRALFKSRKTVYRLFCNCSVQAFGQLAGNCTRFNSFLLQLSWDVVHHQWSHMRSWMTYMLTRYSRLNVLSGRCL